MDSRPLRFLLSLNFFDHLGTFAARVKGKFPAVRAMYTFVADGVHPSALGTKKISGLLHQRFLREAWYRR